ncbi:hypothetical protein KC967_03605 [Candidatus Saccharibacteria bacterium]|nr:hypothetical protein [Candidatus Saccharibacteria bacterium]
MPAKKPTTKKNTTLRHKAHKLARNAVVPHAKNHYRPYLVRRYGLAALLVFVMVLQFGYNFLQTGSVLGQAIDITRQRLLTVTNEERAKQGIADLRLNEALDNAAQAKADDMFAQQYWAHTAPNGATPWQWIGQAGYAYDHAGENLAKGFVSANGVALAWMESPEHRKNMLDTQFQDVGFAVKTGVLDGKTTTIVVALYGTPEYAPGVVDAPKVLAAVDSQIGPISRLGVGLQSMTPAALGSITLLFIAALVALMAHIYRKKLPKQLRQTWYRHHGLYKAAGIGCIVLLLITMYGGGQV